MYELNLDNIIKDHGAFWAFGQAQFEEQRQEGVKYKSIAQLGGLICPAEQVENLISAISKASDAHNKEVKKLIEDEGKRRELIRYTLDNFESFYTHDLTDATNELERYGITSEEVKEEFNRVREEREKITT